MLPNSGSPDAEGLAAAAPARCFTTGPLISGLRNRAFTPGERDGLIFGV
jgi:hypothetical protein